MEKKPAMAKGSLAAKVLFPKKYNEKLELIYPLLRKEVYNETKNSKFKLS